ncbi:MAG: hypothetical protein CL766_05265 [Chloroflexi bacterium]|nr:hypothetical protein [Chloroflexota bacterium]|tara:strand:- start:14714 stop:15931 length:1218 start_codon:yes stop_codon:yes gene_type:complete
MFNFNTKKINIYGPIVMVVVFLSSALSIGPGYAFGMFIKPLQNEFAWSTTEISFALSFAAAGTIFSPFLGSFMDKYGARKLMIIALASMSISFLLRPYITEIWHWYLLSFLQYYALPGSTGLPAGRLVGMWYPRVRGRVMGLVTMGNNFGGLSIPLLIGFALAANKWRIAYYELGFISLFLIILTMLFVREPYVESENNVINKSKLNKIGNNNFNLGDLFKTKTFYLLALSFMFGNFTYSALIPQIPDYLIIKELPRNHLPFLVSLLATFGMFGKASFGYLSEIFTSKTMMVVSLLGQVVFIFFIIYTDNYIFMWIIFPLFGFFMGAYGAIIHLVIQDMYGLKNFGKISGILLFGSVISFFVGPILSGISVDKTGDYAISFIIVAVMFVIGAILLVTISNEKKIL